jgi:3-hydroxyisobutyrate dehydrogenase-like beta-hydroxyacid dehydrogenase
MVDRLVDAGHRVTAFVRRPELASALTASGVQIATSLAGLGRRCSIVIVCVYRDEDVIATVVDGGLLEAMVPGALLVVHTTGSPGTARRLQRAADDRGVVVLDAPLSGTIEDVRRGAVTLLVGGAPTAVEHVRPVLASYADPILHVGELGCGQRVKLVNNLAFAANLELAACLAESLHDFGIDPTMATRAITHCTGASRALEMLARLDSVRDLVAFTAPFVVKDLALARQQARERCVDLGALGSLADAFTARWSGA